MLGYIIANEDVMKKIVVGLSAVLALSVAGVSAAEINVAVAANFTAPIKEISAIYEKESGNKILALSAPQALSTHRLKMVRLTRFCLQATLKHLRKS